MKFQIMEKKDKGCSVNREDYILLSDNYTVGALYTSNHEDNAYLARLFQSAEELLELAVDHGNMGAYEFKVKWFPNNEPTKISKLRDYIKHGDDIVTLKMSRQTAETEKLERFIIKEVS